MVKIERLTPEQEALMVQVRDEWLERVFSLSPLDMDGARAGIEWMYGFAGLKKPKVIECKSPLACQIAANMFREGINEVTDGVWESVDETVIQQVRAQVREQVRDQVGEQVGEQVRDQVWVQVRRHIWARVWDQVGMQVSDRVWVQVSDQVWGQVWSQVRARTVDVDQKLIYFFQLLNCLIGDADWAAWSDFYARIGVGTEHEDAHICREYLKSGVWYAVPLHGVAFICGAPLTLKRDSEHRLHSADGPAAVWADGWAMWRWHGVRVPQQLIVAPDAYTREDFFSERNAEVRRAAQEILGSRFARLLDMVEVDRQRVGTGVNAKDATLLRTREPDAIAGKHIQYVNVLCQSTEREYMLCVPDTITDAWEAVAWTFGKRREEYDPVAEA